MKLSEKLENYRTDRTDEWTMGRLAGQARQLEDALLDARSGMRYIRETHGNLYGVGFDRVEEKAEKALGAPPEVTAINQPTDELRKRIAAWAKFHDVDDVAIDDLWPIVMQFKAAK